MAGFDARRLDRGRPFALTEVVEVERPAVGAANTSGVSSRGGIASTAASAARVSGTSRTLLLGLATGTDAAIDVLLFDAHETACPVDVSPFQRGPSCGRSPVAAPNRAASGIGGCELVGDRVELGLRVDADGCRVGLRIGPASTAGLVSSRRQRTPAASTAATHPSLSAHNVAVASAPASELERHRFELGEPGVTKRWSGRFIRSRSDVIVRGELTDSCRSTYRSTRSASVSSLLVNRMS